MNSTESKPLGFLRHVGVCFLLLMTPTSGLAEAPNEPAPLPDLVALQQKLALLRTPLVWVFTGDSITQGARHLGRERSYPELVQERIRWELKRRRDLFINSGLSGENTAGLLADFDWRVLRLRPDVVSIMIGMNNATQGPAGVEKFESDLREMLARVRAAGAIPILHRTNPIDDASPDSRTRHDLPLYNESIARVAQATQTILVDHWHYWQAKKKEPAALREWLADPIHPNGAGHRQLAIEFFRTLGCYDARAASCQP